VTTGFAGLQAALTAPARIAVAADQFFFER